MLGFHPTLRQLRDQPRRRGSNRRTPPQRVAPHRRQRAQEQAQHAASTPRQRGIGKCRVLRQVDRPHQRCVVGIGAAQACLQIAARLLQGADLIVLAAQQQAREAVLGLHGDLLQVIPFRHHLLQILLHLGQAGAGKIQLHGLGVVMDGFQLFDGGFSQLFGQFRRMRAHAQLDQRTGIRQRLQLEAMAVKPTFGRALADADALQGLVLERNQLQAFQHALQRFGLGILPGWRRADLPDLDPRIGLPLRLGHAQENKDGCEYHDQHGQKPAPFALQDAPHIDQIDFISLHSRARRKVDVARCDSAARWPAPAAAGTRR